MKKTLLMVSGMIGMAAMAQDAGGVKIIENNAPELSRGDNYVSASTNSGSPIFVPKKHIWKSYRSQQREAKKRNNKRKFN